MMQAGAVQAGYIVWSLESDILNSKSGFIHIIVLSEDLHPLNKKWHLQFAWTLGTGQKNLVKQAERGAVRCSFLEWLLMNILEKALSQVSHCWYSCNSESYVPVPLPPQTCELIPAWFPLCAFIDPPQLWTKSITMQTKSSTNWGCPFMLKRWHHTRYHVSYVKKKKQKLSRSWNTHKAEKNMKEPCTTQCYGPYYAYLLVTDDGKKCHHMTQEVQCQDHTRCMFLRVAHCLKGCGRVHLAISGAIFGHDLAAHDSKLLEPCTIIESQQKRHIILGMFIIYPCW